MSQSGDGISVTTTEPLDILIIGAGPVGLATAIAALRQGIQNIRVYDQTSAFTRAGPLLDLFPNAIEALKKIDPRINDMVKHKFSSTDYHKDGHFCTVSGQSLPLMDMNRFGNHAKFHWYELQSQLMKMIPSDLILCNHYLADVVTDENQGIAIANFIKNRRQKSKYKNWGGADQGEAANQEHPEEEVEVRARLVVGADGINSVVRRCIYRDNLPGMEDAATPYYVGLTAVAAFGTLALPAELESALKANILKKSYNSLSLEPEDMTYAKTRMVLMKRRYEGTDAFHMCLYYISIDEKTALTSSKEEMLRKAEEVALLDGYPPEAVAMGSEIVKHVGFDSIIVRPLYVQPVCSPPTFEKLRYGGDSELPSGMERPWYHGRVVLVGDALHAAPPVMGQGAAMGFEDVLVFTELLKKHEVYEESNDVDVQYERMRRTFSEYREVREPRLRRYQKYNMNRTSEGDPVRFQAEREEMYDGISDILQQLRQKPFD